MAKEKKKICLKQVSKDINWQVPRDEAWKYIEESMLLRITEAVELMAQNHRQLIQDRDSYERWYRQEQERRYRLEKQIAGLRGYITKLKKRVE